MRMASRALVRRKSVISDCLHSSVRSVQYLRCLGHEHAPPYGDLHGYSNIAELPSADVDRKSNSTALLIAKDKLLSDQGFGHFGGICGNAGYVRGNVRQELMHPFGLRWMLHSTRHASTAAAKQQELGSDDEGNEDLVAKRRKEASAEDCDEAVADLSSAKAKAKAKKLQESQRAAESILQRVWASLLGIGPALRAVASMSRLGYVSYFLK